MKMNPKIVILSEDYIFTTILQGLININIESPTIIIYESFRDLKKISVDDNIDLIILDDKISGTASHELESYIRKQKKILCTIYYFSNDDYDEEKKSIERGVNRFFKKPFNPQNVIDHILELFESIPANNILLEIDDEPVVKSKRRKFLKSKKTIILAVSIIALCVSFGMVSFSGKGSKNLAAENTIIPHSTAKSNVSIAKPDSTNFNTKEIQHKITTITKNQYSEYHIIAGKYYNLQHANFHKNELLKSGYPAKIISYKKQLLVSIHTTKNKNEAQIQLQKLQKQLNYSILWILKKNVVKK